MPTTIETLDEWNELKNTLLEFDYNIWQIQFSIEQTEGYIVTFADPCGRELKITTHNPEVEKAIIRFRPGQSGGQR